MPEGDEDAEEVKVIGDGCKELGCTWKPFSVAKWWWKRTLCGMVVLLDQALALWQGGLFNVAGRVEGGANWYGSDPSRYYVSFV